MGPGYEDRSHLTTPQWFKRLILKELGNGNLLEIGCGGGALLAEISESTSGRVVGCDLKRERAKVAENRLPDIVQCDGCSLPFADETFDVVVAIELLEHIPEPKYLIRDIIRVLSPSGSIFIKTPNKFTHDVFHLLKRDLVSTREYHPSVLTHNDLETMFPNDFAITFLRADMAQYQIEKLPSVLRPIANKIPFRYLPNQLQPSIYAVVQKENS